MSIVKSSTWESISGPQLPKLDENKICDVAVVGGGLAGLLTAYLLSKTGRRVVVLEKDKIGSGATGLTTAFITQAIDTDLPELAKIFGSQQARLVWESGTDAINLIEQIQAREKIECEFMRCGVFEYANTPENFDSLKQEQGLATEMGFDVSETSRNNDLKFPNAGYYEIRNQAKFHPLKFLYGLVPKITASKSEIYEQSEVVGIRHTDENVIVETNAYKVTARDVVIATYEPFHNRLRMFLKRGMYKSFVYEASLPKNAIPAGLYIDNNNPYHYFRVDSGEEFDRIIIGGEDIKSIVKMDDEKNFLALEEYLKKIAGDYKIVRKWTGPILEPSDGPALIGQTREHEYIASAFSGNGMTYSALAGMICSDLITGKSNVYAKIFDPGRIPSFKQLFAKASDYIEEFFEGAAKNALRKKPQSQT